MEPANVLASGLTLEESRAKRQEKQAARYRHRLGTYVPSGDSKGLLEALIATSPRKSPSPRKSMTPKPTKPRKSVKRSTKGNNSNEVAHDSAQEAEKQPKPRKPASRKSIKATGPSEEVNLVERNAKGASRSSVSKARVNTVEEVEGEPEPSTSRQTGETKSVVNSKTTKPRKKSTTTKKPRRPKLSSHNTNAETDLDSHTVPSKSSAVRQKKASGRPRPPIDDESDDLAIKKTSVPRKANKGKARSMDSLPETFESAGTDIDLEESRPGPSNLRSGKERASNDAPPDAHEANTISIIPRVVSDRGDASGEEEQQYRPLPKKRGRPRNDEGLPPKRGKIQKSNNDGEEKGPTTSKSRRQPCKSSPKPRPTTAKGRTRKDVDSSPGMSNAERDESVSSETTAPGSNSRKRQQRKLHDGADYKKRNETDRDETNSNPSRVRLDSIPPEGIIIRKKNGIVERLLPPVIKPKRNAPSNRGKTRGSRRRAIPAHVLKYIGPNRIGSPLKGKGTDTDDDLNL